MKVSELLNDLAARGHVHLVDCVNWVLKCSHRHTSIPMSVRTEGRHGDQHAPPSQPYVVCQSCGRRLSYSDSGRPTEWRDDLTPSHASGHEYRGHR
jgi:hypothetical protein